MEAYRDLVRKLTWHFEKFGLIKIPRAENTSADALAALASTSDPIIKRVLPVEGITKPSIEIPLKTSVDTNELSVPTVALAQKILDVTKLFFGTQKESMRYAQFWAQSL